MSDRDRQPNDPAYLKRQAPRRRKGGKAGFWFRVLEAGTGGLGATAAVVFLISSFAYAASLSGQFSSITSTFTRLGDTAASLVGLSADNISISGLKHARREDVFEIIGVSEGGSMIGFDTASARTRLEAEDWIASASILRQFPNTLHIEIEERAPFAIWQNEGRFSVIDEAGTVLSRLPVRAYLDLPIVVGKGAGKNAFQLINDLEAWSGVKSSLRAAVRVADRRWTLYFLNGIKVLLPEEGVDQALRELDRLDREQGLMSRAVDVIDLRLAERTIVRLTDAAASARKAELAAVSRR